MSRPESHKQLVNAVVDGEIDADKIIADAKEFASALAQKLNAMARNLVKLRLSGKITSAKARSLYREGFVAISLAGFAEVAGDVDAHAVESTDKIIEAARALGKDVANVTEIRDEDKLAREADRATS